MAICEIALGVRWRLVNIEGGRQPSDLFRRGPNDGAVFLLDLVDIFSRSRNCLGDTRLAPPGHLVNTHARETCTRRICMRRGLLYCGSTISITVLFFFLFLASVAIQFKRESRPPKIDLPSVHYVQCPAVNISQLTD